MGFKEFLKPTKRRLWILVLLLVLTLLIPKPAHVENMDGYIATVRDFGVGYPWIFLGVTTMQDIGSEGFFLVPFLIEFPIYYILVCLLDYFIKIYKTRGGG